MRIRVGSERTSDRISKLITADTLHIPMADSPADEDGHVKTASVSEDATKVAGTGCPQCGAALQKSGSMERCAGCGYAQASATTEKPVMRKSAKEIDVAQYYKQLFPDAYVKEMTKDTPSKPKDKVEYEVLPSDKPVKASKSVDKLVLAAQKDARIRQALIAAAVKLAEFGTDDDEECDPSDEDCDSDKPAFLKKKKD